MLLLNHSPVVIFLGCQIQSICYDIFCHLKWVLYFLCFVHALMCCTPVINLFFTKNNIMKIQILNFLVIIGLTTRQLCKQMLRIKESGEILLNMLYSIMKTKSVSEWIFFCYQHPLFVLDEGPLNGWFLVWWSQMCPLVIMRCIITTAHNILQLA